MNIVAPELAPWNQNEMPSRVDQSWVTHSSTPPFSNPWMKPANPVESTVHLHHVVGRPNSWQDRRGRRLHCVYRDGVIGALERVETDRLAVGHRRARRQTSLKVIDDRQVRRTGARRCYHQQSCDQGRGDRCTEPLESRTSHCVPFRRRPLAPALRALPGERSPDPHSHAGPCQGQIGLASKPLTEHRSAPGRFALIDGDSRRCVPFVPSVAVRDGPIRFAPGASPTAPAAAAPERNW